MKNKIKIIVDKRNLFWTALILVVIGLSIFWLKTNQTTGNRLAKITLSAPTKVKQNEKFTLTISIDSQGLEVDAADIVIDYNEKFLSVDNIKEGNFFSLYPVKKKSDGSIKISGTAALQGSKIVIPKGKGDVAKIEFKAKKRNGLSEIKLYAEKTIIASSGINILDKNSLPSLLITVY